MSRQATGPSGTHSLQQAPGVAPRLPLGRSPRQAEERTPRRGNAPTRTSHSRPQALAWSNRCGSRRTLPTALRATDRAVHPKDDRDKRVCHGVAKLAQRGMSGSTLLHTSLA